ncbi:MAG TPA: nickel transporter [Casimicrobiaceae bacterium]|nr:nickel transporter [Casimicrobiaceae bacterium]
MDALPATWTALCLLAFVLGLKHGFDADHLATIDGLTRYNARANPALARVAGALFSLGHGVVVLLVALVAGTLSAGWQTPGWLELTGAAVSVLFLFGLAFFNLHAVLTSAANAVVAPSGLKARLLGRVLTVRRPWAIAAVGMLFALSFDTVSQAALFALAAGRFGGVSQALFVAGLFVLGMLTVDGINGVWISALIRRADRTAVIASRVMALAVAAISLAVGVFTVAKLLLPALDAWAASRELVFGTIVVSAVIAAFLAAMRAARRYEPAAATPERSKSQV